MRGDFLPLILTNAFLLRPELRAKLMAHFGVSDWKMSQWESGAKKPEPGLRQKVIDYVRGCLHE